MFVYDDINYKWGYVFNKYFQNIAITSQHRPAIYYVLPSDDMINNDNCFMFDKISVLAVLSRVTSLGVMKSTGPDRLSAQFLKEILMKL